jgi:SAM-dependent methyltransferase
MAMTSDSRIYAEGYDVDEHRQPLLAFYLNRWRQAGSPTPLLEPMCGTGFFLIPFLEAGADIDGFDASPHMLAECRRKCAAKGLTPTLYQQLLEEMTLPRQYGFIFIPDRSFALIYDLSAAQECLHQLAKQLLPGGWLVLDLKPKAREGEFGEAGQTEVALQDRPDGAIVLSTSILSRRDEGRVIRNVTKFEKFVGGELIETELFDYNERMYEWPTIERMLRAAGFTELGVTKAYEDTAPGPQDRYVVTARKT